MRCLKLKLYQEVACYTKPFAFKVGETYPLPPYSTVLGMLHRVLGATEYQEGLGISIQGRYEDKFVDYRSTYLYKGKEITRSPLNVHQLFGVELIIHVSGPESILERLHSLLKAPKEFLSLGRKEDLVRIDEISWVSVTEVEEYFQRTISYDLYVPIKGLENKENIMGIRYRLNTRYHLLNGMRVWEKVDVLYLTEGDVLEEPTYLQDSEGDVLYIHTP